MTSVVEVVHAQIQWCLLDLFWQLGPQFYEQSNHTHLVYTSFSSESTV